MKTLEEIDQLERSRYGRPQPRHGLKLLYWFANDCLSLDQNNVLQLSCSPQNGDFGFHQFQNRHERNGGKLLPDVTFPYYVVGNLSYVNASKMPNYVWKDYTGSQDNSNMDRIIVSVKNKWLHTVYATQHSDLSNFSKHATYSISKHLILIIRNLTLEEFLLRTGYLKQQTLTSSTIPLKIPTYLSNPEPPRSTPPVTSSCIPAITSSTNQDVCIQIESPPIMANTQRHTSEESKVNKCVWDDTIQNLRISNLQPPCRDNQTPSHCTPTIMSSRNQNIDIESSPVSQINPYITTDGTKTCPTSIFGMARHCNCTIL